MNYATSFIQFILLVSIFYNFHVDSIKFTIEPICLVNSSPESVFKLSCGDKNTRLFITQQQYTNDFNNYCNNTISDNMTLTKCSAFPTQRLANQCNGKLECEIKLDETSFTYGFMGSNCNFDAEIMFISYECIPVNFYDKFIPKYDICSGSSSSSNLIDHPIHGFIHTPSYPNTYQPRQFCQLTIRVDETVERVEIFLIDMQLEGLSTTTYKPTDYLQINSNEQLFGDKSYTLVYNETNTAVIKFQSDRWFNKRGFLLYFQAMKRIKRNESLTTTTISSTTTTTTTTTTIETTTLNSTNSSSSDVFVKSSYASIQMSTKDLNESKATSYLDMTTRLIFILIVVIGVLSVLVIVLLFTKRVSICGDPRALNVSKIDIGNRMSETTNLDYYMGNMDKSAVISTTCNSINYLNNNSNIQLLSNHASSAAFYKVNYLSKRPDDSQVQLLINGSLNCSEPIGNQTEVYEDIKLDYNAKKIDNHISENLKRCNEYCYIPSNVIKSDNTSDENVNLKTECANLDSISSITTNSSSSSSPSLPSPSKITSTPNASKYLTPTNFDTPNEYKIFMDEDDTINDKTAITTADANTTTITMINKEEDELNYEYQIPSNLPTNK